MVHPRIRGEGVQVIAIVEVGVMEDMVVMGEGMIDRVLVIINGSVMEEEIIAEEIIVEDGDKRGTCG
jgi:hypothetical protein